MVHVRKFLTGLTGFGAATALSLAPLTPAHAQEEAPVNSGAISVSAGADVTSKYYFRGLLQEDQGLIIQPWAEIGATVLEKETGPIQTVSVFGGIWNSFHDTKTGDMTTGGNGASSWYEADLYAGASVGLDGGFSTGITYTAYTSPNDAFSTIQEVSVSGSFDDSEFWGDSGFALSPSAVVAFELDNTATLSSPSSEGIYLGLGISPSMEVVQSEDYPITLSVPVTVGLGLDDYYVEAATGDDELFGYASVKPTASMPLGFMPDKFGDWEGYVGVEFLYLGDATEDDNNGDDFEVIGSIGLSMAY